MLQVLLVATLLVTDLGLFPIGGVARGSGPGGSDLPRRAGPGFRRAGIRRVGGQGQWVLDGFRLHRVCGCFIFCLSQATLAGLFSFRLPARTERGEMETYVILCVQPLMF